MKLREYSRKQARNFLVSWMFIYLFFGLMTIAFFFSNVEVQLTPWIPTSVFWPHTILMVIVLFSLLISGAGMWTRYQAGQFEYMRFWRNIPFYVLLVLYPIGIIIKLIMKGM